MGLKFNILSNNGISIVSFEGKIMSTTDLEVLNSTIDTTSFEKTKNWIFDFKELSHVNSSGINFIIRSLTRSRINEGDLVLCSITGNVKTVFEMAKITEIFTIYEDVSTAINHFKN